MFESDETPDEIPGTDPGEGGRDDTGEATGADDPGPLPRSRRAEPGIPVPSPGTTVPDDFEDRIEARRRQAALIVAQGITDTHIQVRHIMKTLTVREQNMEFRSLYQRIALVENLSDRTVSARVNTAVLLKTRYLPVFEHLEHGDFTYQIAEILPTEGFQINDPDAETSFMNIMLPHALTPGMTPAKLRRLAKEIAATLTDTTIEERQTEARLFHTYGGVRVTDLDDGFVELRMIMSAIDGYAIKDRITRVAKAKQVHQARARDAWRATRTGAGVDVDADVDADADADESVTTCTAHGDDICDAMCEPSIDALAVLEHETATELLTASLHPNYHHIRGEIRVTVPLLSLETGRSRHSVTELQHRVGTIAGLSGGALLEGYGPIPVQDLDTLCAVTKEWQRMFVNPDTGVVMATDKRKPSKALQRFLHFRDPTCRWPGCNIQSGRCDTDHTVEWRYVHDTSPGNTEQLCRSHHVLRHNSGMKIKQLGDGVIEWTLATGKTLIDEPYQVPKQRPVGAKGTGVCFEAPQAGSGAEAPPPF